MRFGIYLPSVNRFADPGALVEIACAAEESGWDGVFLWDHVAWTTGEGPARIADTWVTLGAMASRTGRVRIGPLVTPAARRRPQKLAREAVSVDRLSGGRLTLGVGLGSPAEEEFGAFGEEADARIRAQRLDEGLELVRSLWSGGPVEFEGVHHRASTSGFVPGPVQSPRIPIWVAGSAKPRPIARAARWDGMFPMSSGWPEKEYGAAEYASIRRRIEGLRGDDGGGFDLVHASVSRPLPEAEEVAEMGAAGVTWWLSSFFVDGSPEDAMALASVRPPRAE
ncbi:MAG TPA: LLM class flavin-dependent oxidoreductase [Solirubrobacterales bacterium]|nr:LLM class flavin-dependent oxidoreductase [Solirubrobacterales bacterium]